MHCSLSSPAFAVFWRRPFLLPKDLAWINAKCPSKPLYHSPFSTGQGRGNMMKGSRVEIRTERDHSPITVMDKTD